MLEISPVGFCLPKIGGRKVFVFGIDLGIDKLLTRFIDFGTCDGEKNGSGSGRIHESDQKIVNSDDFPLVVS